MTMTAMTIEAVLLITAAVIAAAITDRARALLTVPDMAHQMLTVMVLPDMVQAQIMVAPTMAAPIMVPALTMALQVQAMAELQTETAILQLQTETGTETMTADSLTVPVMK